MAYTEWEKGYAYQEFMDSRPISGICGSINHRTNSQYEVADIHEMIVQFIKESNNER